MGTEKKYDAKAAEMKARALKEDISFGESIDVEKDFAATLRRAKRRAGWHSFSRTMLKVAAALAIPLAVAAYLFASMYFNEKDEPQRMVKVEAAKGTIVKYTLPDNSDIWLNSGSVIEFPTSFRKGRREVSIDGEVYFNVEADSKSPFYVNTPQGLTVYVYGTRFNVDAYSSNDYVDAVLESGKVNVIAPDNRYSRLAPGYGVHYDATTKAMTSSKVDVELKTAWKDGALIFRNASLEEIFASLERHFNVEIEFHNHSGKENSYRATFKDETLTEILDYLAQSANLKWKIIQPVQMDDDTITHEKIEVDLY